MLDDLTRAVIFASLKHWCQLDKAGQPYIAHLTRVMHRVTAMGQGVMRLAILHDVLEDTDATLDELRQLGLDETDILTLFLLTRNPSEQYAIEIERIAATDNKVALAIKRADLQDHLDGVEHIEERLQKRYEKALARIEVRLEELG